MENQPPYKSKGAYVPKSVEYMDDCAEEGRTVNMAAKDILKYKVAAQDRSHHAIQSEHLEGIREELSQITAAIKAATNWIVAKG